MAIRRKQLASHGPTIELVFALIISWVLSTAAAMAKDITVNNSSQFSAALNAATSGDQILLSPGTYSGGHFVSGLENVTIRSLDAGSPAIIQGGANAIQLSDARNVTLEHLILTGQTGNGLNIDDGGSFSTPSTNITLRNLVVRDIATSGNRDGIKLSGVTHFLVENVTVENWGDGGSAIDMVGSHHGLVQNSLFRHDSIGVSGSGVRPKGGSKSITVRANRFELPNGNGRPLQVGGSTDSQFFRFIDGDAGYEASNVLFEGNVVVGGSSSMAYVNIDGGVAQYNLLHGPDDWVVRILNENRGNAIVDTQNGIFSHNRVVFDDDLRSDINIGNETLPGSFQFVENHWYNISNPADSVPSLPTAEVNGTYGVASAFGVDDVAVWEFGWGVWLVNATRSEKDFVLDDDSAFLQAVPSPGSRFDSRSEIPFAIGWQLSPNERDSISLEPFSQVFLPFDSCEGIASSRIPGDADGDGEVAFADFLSLAGNFGTDAGYEGGDFDCSGEVAFVDFLELASNFGIAAEAAVVPEPSSIRLSGMAVLFVRLLRRRR